jgi:hypothetical protein
VIGIQLAVIWPAAMQRALDGDEGFYSIAAKLVAHGQVPYFDFWFQHAPVLPYVYGAWTRLTDESYVDLRALSALLTVAIGVLLYAHIARRFSRPLGFAAVLLYVTSYYVFFWYSTFKSYALSTLLLFGAYVAVARIDDDEDVGTVHWLLAGILLGLSAGVRLLFLAVVPVFVFYALWSLASRSTRLTRAGTLLGGVVVGSVPCLYFLLRDTPRFIRDTLISQTTRSDMSLADSLAQKSRTLGHLMLDEVQFPILLLGVVIVCVLALLAHKRVPLAVAIVVALAVTSLAPTPVYDQYFATLIPFLVVIAIECWVAVRALVLRRLGGRGHQLMVRVVGVAVLLTYVIGGAVAYNDVLDTRDSERDVEAVNEVASAIDAIAHDGEVVIAFWPGHLYESHAEPLSGLESNFATSVVADMDLPPERAAEYRMLPIDRLEEIVRSGEVRIVVLDPNRPEARHPRPWPEILAESSYRPVTSVHDFVLYEHRDTAR